MPVYYCDKVWLRPDVKRGAHLKESFAMIVEPSYGFCGDSNRVGLHFGLSTAEHGLSTHWEMYEPSEIADLLSGLNVKEIIQLDGKTVTIYRDSPISVAGIGINPNLVKRS